MRATRRPVLVCTFMLASAFHISGFTAPPPVEAYGVTPQVSNVQLNSTGDLLAWSDHSGDTPVVVMFDLGGRKEKRRIALDADAKLRGLKWADEETLLINISVTNAVGAGIGSVEYEWFRTLAAQASGGSPRLLLMTDRERSWVTGADLVAAHSAKPHTVIMSSWDYSQAKAGRTIDSRLAGGRQDSGWIYNLFEVDTRSGKGKLIDYGTHLTNEWVVDRSGRSVARGEWISSSGYSGCRRGTPPAGARSIDRRARR